MKINKKNYISKLFGSLEVIMAMFMTLACEKEEIINNLSVEADSNAVLYNLKVDEDGIIVFKNTEEYNQAVAALEKLSQSERLNWESRIGFESDATGLLNASREINSAQTEEEFYQSLNKNSKYFYIKKLENGEESVERTTQTTLYNFFTNRNGLFVIQDTIFRITDKGMLVHTNLKNKNEILNKSEDEIELLSGNSEYAVFNVFAKPYSEEKEFYGDVDTLRAERLYDPSGISNDRWVKIKVMAYYQFNTGLHYYGKVQIQVYGKKKNFFGTWVQYETIYSHRDVSYALKYQIVGGSATWHDNSWTFPDQESSDDELEFYTYHTFDDDIHISTGYPARFYFVSLFAEGSSRGMNNNWAQIDY